MYNISFINLAENLRGKSSSFISFRVDQLPSRSGSDSSEKTLSLSTHSKCRISSRLSQFGQCLMYFTEQKTQILASTKRDEESSATL